jgi:3-oxoacyl-[acyl-carrier-protein] synthase II
MEIYIGSASCISHYNTVSEDFFFEGTPVIPGSNKLLVTPPPYKDYIPANTLRRTSGVLKMGISAGMMCLKKSGKEKPEAIIVGTGIGCYEDTDKFLKSIGDNDERMLTPTSFIQSTHNTVAGQIGLLTKCHGYNFTYVHQNLSFEYALIDAMMLLKEKETENVLVGGLDELSPSLAEQFERAGHIKKADELKEPIWKSRSTGFIAGEGAAFFNLTSTSSLNNLAKINGVKPIQKIDNKEHLIQETQKFLKELGIKEKIDLVLSGVTGDSETDQKIKAFNSEVGAPVAYFKNLCGEYFTASAFALWFAANILKKQLIPECANPEMKINGDINHILIVNHYNDKQYSIMSVSKCQTI